MQKCKRSRSPPLKTLIDRTTLELIDIVGNGSLMYQEALAKTYRNHQFLRQETRKMLTLRRTVVQLGSAKCGSLDRVLLVDRNEHPTIRDSIRGLPS